MYFSVEFRLPCMSSHSLHPQTFGGKTLGNPKVGTKLHTVLLHCQLLSLLDYLCRYEGALLINEVKLLESLVNTETSDKVSYVPHLLTGVLDVVSHVADIGWPVGPVW